MQCLLSKMNTAYLSLGTNLGNKTENLNEAIRKISRRIGHIKAQSAFLPTEPWGFSSSNSFLNAAICVETPLSPTELLETTQAIERDMGRTKKSSTNNGKVTYTDRIIDIDILLYYEGSNATPVFDADRNWGGTISINTERLTIPHPHMLERDFVLIPLKEIL